MDDIISGSYWTQAYCEKEKLDYEEQNESFFDLLQTAINAHCGEKIALYIPAIQSTVSLKKSSCKT